MGVLDTVALLNKTVATTSTAGGVCGSFYNGRLKRHCSGESDSTTRELQRIKKTASGGVASIRNKFDSVAAPRLPPVTKKQQPRSVNRLATFDAIADELAGMYQSLLDQNRSCVNKSKCSATDTCPMSDIALSGNSPPSLLTAMSSPPSPPQSAADLGEENGKIHVHRDGCPIQPNDKPHHPDPNEHEHSTATKENQHDETQEEKKKKDLAGQLLFLDKQKEAQEKGVHMMIEKHTQALESERRQRRMLEGIIQKQDELIAALEAQRQSSISEDTTALLYEQMKLQQTELEDKRSLLTRLLDEREEMMRVIEHIHRSQPRQQIERQSDPSNASHHNGRSRSSSVRSSIDVLVDFAKPNQLLTDMRHATRTITPPSAPPKEPLPPLPPSDDELSLRASSSDTFRSSPTTSWSSTDYEHHGAAAFLQKQLKPMDMMSKAMDHEARFDDDHRWASNLGDVTPFALHNGVTDMTKERKRTGPFWKGWKQKLGSR